jgi:hypothetical protein
LQVAAKSVSAVTTIRECNNLSVMSRSKKSHLLRACRFSAGISDV